MRERGERGDPGSTLRSMLGLLPEALAPAARMAWCRDDVGGCEGYTAEMVASLKSLDREGVLAREAADVGESRPLRNVSNSACSYWGVDSTKYGVVCKHGVIKGTHIPCRACSTLAASGIDHHLLCRTAFAWHLTSFADVHMQTLHVHIAGVEQEFTGMKSLQKVGLAEELQKAE